MPSHQGSSSGVTPTLVKMVLRLRARMTLGLVFIPVPGATPKKPASGLMAWRKPSASDVHPGDVVADGPNLVALGFEGGNHHGQVGFAAGAGKRRGHVGDFAARGFEAEDKHMLGHPALLASQVTGDAEGEALFAKERVAAVARADAPDEALFGEVSDVAAERVEIAKRVKAGNEVGGIAKAVGGDFADAGHDAHVGDDVRTVRDLDADFAERGMGGAHDVRHDVHGAAAHGAVEQSTDFVFGAARIHPIVGGTDVVFVGSTDEGEVFCARDVTGTAAVKITIGIGFGIELEGIHVLQHLVEDGLVFGFRAVAKNDAIGLGKLGGLVHPGFHRSSHGLPLQKTDAIHAKNKSTSPNQRVP